MLGRSHFIIGAATGAWWVHVLRLPAGFALALGATRLPFGGHVPHLLAQFTAEVIALAIGVSFGGIAALLPDADEPHSLVGRFLPAIWHEWTPGHRGCTHSLLATAIWSFVAWLTWYVMVLTGVASSPSSAPVIGAAAASVARELGSLVAVCYVSHLLADSVTDHGVRWLYLPPFLAQLLPRALRQVTQVHFRTPVTFTTGTRPEPFAVAFAVAVAVCFGYDLPGLAHVIVPAVVG
jgi:inner membrane protein